VGHPSNSVGSNDLVEAALVGRVWGENGKVGGQSRRS